MKAYRERNIPRFIDSFPLARARLGVAIIFIVSALIFFLFWIRFYSSQVIYGTLSYEGNPAQIVAPFDGLITKRYVEANKFLSMDKGEAVIQIASVESALGVDKSKYLENEIKFLKSQVNSSRAMLALLKSIQVDLLTSYDHSIASLRKGVQENQMLLELYKEQLLVIGKGPSYSLSDEVRILESISAAKQNIIAEQDSADRMYREKLLYAENSEANINGISNQIKTKEREIAKSKFELELLVNMSRFRVALPQSGKFWLEDLKVGEMLWKGDSVGYFYETSKLTIQGVMTKNIQKTTDARIFVQVSKENPVPVEVQEAGISPIVGKMGVDGYLVVIRDKNIIAESARYHAVGGEVKIVIVPKGYSIFNKVRQFIYE